MINVAVIGTGYIGPVHIEALRRISGITVKGVTDANPELARKTAEKYNIEKVYRDYTEILADPSIHVIHTCSPNSQHFPMNKAAIEKGKHILSEKPLAMTLDQAKELTEGIVNSSIDGIVAVDAELRYTVWNPGMEAISGQPGAACLGRRSHEVFPGLADSPEGQGMRRALEGKAPEPMTEPTPQAMAVIRPSSRLSWRVLFPFVSVMTIFP